MLADDLAAALAAADGQGLTAAQLARSLDSPEREVSFALLASHGRFRRDRGSSARWSLASASATGGRSPPSVALAAAAPGDALQLYRWQADALHEWRRRGARGVVEAVTGAGKTMVGVAAVLDELRRRGQAVVLVPTVELAHQWVAGLEPRLPAGRVGRMGAGGDDSLATHDVLVAVVNSARSLDVRPIRQGGLLVADECHRYGSANNRLALDPRFRHRLGLSATYAREDDGNLTWLDPYFGGTCFRLGYARAVAEGITARFTVSLVGVVLGPDEQVRYHELTDLMAALRARLIHRHGVPAEPFEVFLRAVTALAEGDDDGSRAARLYRQAMRERRRLLADTPAKDQALARIAPAIGDADRAIVFTQSIAASERASRTLAASGLRAAVMHSGLVGAERRGVLARFAAGGLDVLSAPRVLDEGIDVPAADLAVIVGASRSRRQMVQRMGRVLRLKPDGRHARFAVLFVEGTVEDPRSGAHEAFLGEVVGVADEVACFTSEMVLRRPGAVLESLRPPAGSR
ncbi:MAG: DEAD/DEAH box helicase [Acidimicrobiales bacterium]